MLATHASPCAKICCAIAFLSTASLRLRGPSFGDGAGSLAFVDVELAPEACPTHLERVLKIYRAVLRRVGRLAALLVGYRFLSNMRPPRALPSAPPRSQSLSQSIFKTRSYFLFCSVLLGIARYYSVFLVVEASGCRGAESVFLRSLAKFFMLVIACYSLLRIFGR